MKKDVKRMRRSFNKKQTFFEFISFIYSVKSEYLWECEGSSVIASVNTQSDPVLRHCVTEYFLENFRNQGEP